MANQDEFRAEMPAAAPPELLKTGERIEDEGAYYCINCRGEDPPPMVNLEKGQMIPVCASCGPASRWRRL
jgi:hypothetical protein